MAIHTWIGQAIPIKQIDTITFALTWTDADTVKVIIGSRSFTVTVNVGGTPTANDVAAMVAAAINAGSATSGIQNAETRDVGGQEIPQFREVIATNAGAIVTVTATVAGVPFTMSVTETTFGSGTAVETTATAATGPNHLGNVDNWDTELAAITHLDTVRFDNGNIPVLYQLDYFRTLGTPLRLHWTRTTRYTGRIGPLKINPAGYLEYRDRFYQHFDGTGDTVVTFETDPNNLVGGTTQFNADGQTVASINVRGTGNTLDKQVILVGGTYTLNAAGGNIEVGPDYETAPSTIGVLTVLAGSEVTVGNSNLRLLIGPYSGICDASNATTTSLTVLSGRVYIQNTLYIDGTHNVNVVCYVGADVIYDSPGNDLFAVTIFGGAFRWIFNGLATARSAIVVWTGSTWDVSGGTANPAYAATFQVFGGATIIYGGAHPSVDWTLDGCWPEQVNVIAA